ncbi:MAG: class IV adenylate cyclase [Terriglobia bacterium]
MSTLAKKADENEVKIAAPDVQTLRTALRAAGFRVLKRRVFEQNIVLDDPAKSLRSRGLLLRLRWAGKVVTCTFKGANKPGPHKRREEREFHSDSVEECLAVFKGLGYEPSFRYEKYRTEFFRAGEPGIATLDETRVGVFMELEGPARWIDRTAKALGYSRDDYITASYVRLFTEFDAGA